MLASADRELRDNAPPPDPPIRTHGVNAPTPEVLQCPLPSQSRQLFCVSFVAGTYEAKSYPPCATRVATSEQQWALWVERRRSRVNVQFKASERERAGKGNQLRTTVTKGGKETFVVPPTSRAHNVAWAEAYLPPAPSKQEFNLSLPTSILAKLVWK